ncbi:uncharacterized membrane protein YgdD (TMEM256/DUF423 family) [Marinimicrobium koreense]|jgi:uncharacterized membrane protein YgdD (TMEM256/DUF423 family)|uniref:Uncharacterized membrane protein YgdD (TMEM256/DUF423 family) n=1 Tax=Marinimicrobium koreense TaxID=306545 RepID=A0A3N1NRZ4_9GAMM|nr:DUF423 domain-containing protein [Marinimicrobium koreense]ROQ21622.1 uncharacterized membrane protein YgdD (TMEM256/DUF423 family) [Marinimicrobium koreense]
MAAVFLVLAALFGLLSVMLGAFAAHGLKARLPASALSAFETGVQYQMYHALALLAVVALLRWFGPTLSLLTAGWAFVLGVLLFSGSLYGLALGGPRWLGPVTPLGGLCFMMGWVLLLAVGIRALKT